MKNPDLGELVNWSRGTKGVKTKADAMAHTQKVLETLNSRSLDKFQNAGLTKEMAQQWADFYRHEARLRPSNPNAEARSILMQAIADLY